MVRIDVEQERNQNDEKEETRNGKMIHSVILIGYGSSKLALCNVYITQ